MSGRFLGAQRAHTHWNFLAGLLFLASLLCGCDQAASVLPPPKGGTFRFVSSFPRKGPLAHQSQQMVNAIDLALRDAQARQPNVKIEHIALDDSDSETGDWSPVRELENARAAADDRTVVAYVGPYNTGATGVSLPVTSRAGLLQIGPTATWPGLTNGGWDPNEPEKYYSGARNFVRLMPPDSREAQAAARWASHSGAKRVVTLSDGSSYSDGLAREFEAEAARLGLSTADKRTLEQLTETQLDADAVFYAPSTASQAALAAGVLASAAPNAAVYSTDTALSDQFLDAVGDAARNWHIVHNGVDTLPASAEANEFSRAYGEEYNEAPGQFAANAYDAASLVVRAIASGAGDRDSVRERVMSTRYYQGAAGVVSLDSSGDNTAWQMTGYDVAGGSFTGAVVLSATAAVKSR